MNSYVIPAHVDRCLVYKVAMLLGGETRGRYLAAKLVQSRLDISLKQAKAIVARVGNFTWSCPMPRK